MPASRVGSIPTHIIASVFGIPVEFLLFGLTLAGVALFHHRTLQVALSGLAAIVLYKVAVSGFDTGPGRGRAAGASRPRVGDPRQPGRPAPGLRHPVEALREESRAAGAAAVPAGRLERGLRAPGDRLRALGVSRQHRRGDDRRGAGAHALRQGAHRVPGGDRRGVERRRFRERGRRHHDHDDVDRRRLAVRRVCTPTSRRYRRCWCRG